MNRRLAQLSLGVIVSLAFLLPIRWAAAQDNWTDGTGNWNTPGNWSVGVPGNIAIVNIVNSDSISRTVTYNYTGAAVSLDQLYIDLTGGSGSATNTVSMSANNLTASQEFVGLHGSGTFIQSGGANAISDFLSIGQDSGSSGLYTFSNGSLTESSEIDVGYYGTGNFNQSGGTNTVSNPTGGDGILDIGYQSGSTGTYTLSGTGSLYISGGRNINGYEIGSENVGLLGTGHFNQSGGTNTVGSDLSVGVESGSIGTYTQSGGTNRIGFQLVVGQFGGSTGTYNLSGTGSLTSFGSYTSQEYVGYQGTGYFVQSGGTNATYDLVLGLFGGSSGTYTLSGGTLNAVNIQLGAYGSAGSGQGIFSVSGTGSATVSGTLFVLNANSGDALNFSGGTISAGSLNLDGNNSHFNWTGGTLNITGSSVPIDDSVSDWNGYSSLTLNTGMALEVSLPETVGFSGTGSVTLAGGRNSVGASGLYVGYGSGSHGTYTIGNNGTLTSFGGETIGSSGTGILNQTGGQNSLFSGSLALGVNSGSSGTYTLSGGTLSANDIYIGGSSAGPGGTGVLTISGSGSLTSSSTITVYNTPGSGFNVNGGTVSAAALNLMGTYTHTAGNATYGHITRGGQMNVSGGQVILTDDTSGHLSSVNVSGPATLGFDIGTSRSSQITADTATFTATPTITLTLSGIPDGGTVFTLLSATHLNDDGFLSSLSSQAVTIGRDTLTPLLTGGGGSAGAIIVTVSGGPANLTWIGSNNIGFDGAGAWDTQTTQNWENHSNEALTPDVFYAGDHVTFDDTAANFVVDLNSGDVVAKTVTFNNSLNVYTVNGFNGIAGAANVTFAGSNTVALNNYNSYVGTTTISGGGLVSIAGSIASPTINVTHGTLQLATSSALTGTPAVTLGNGTTTGMLDLDGTTNTVGGLAGGAGNIVTNTNPNQATLYYSGGSSTFGGLIQDGASGGQIALNITSGSLTLCGANTYSGGTTVSGGTLAVNGSILGDVAVNYGGTLAGRGSVAGMVNVNYGAFLSPGSDASHTGTLTLGGLTLYSGSQTNIKLAGTTPGSQYDQVQVTGSASLAGTLAVSLINGFSPLAGETFDILTGSTPAGIFDTLQLPNLAGALSWNTSQLYTDGALSVVETFLPGDFNRDGHVDAADILPMMQALTNLSAYKTNYEPNLSASELTLLGDFNGDGNFTNADLQGFLNYLTSGGGSTDSVPEPATVVLAGLGFLGVFACAWNWRWFPSFSRHA